MRESGKSPNDGHVHPRLSESVLIVCGQICATLFMLRNTRFQSCMGGLHDAPGSALSIPDDSSQSPGEVDLWRGKVVLFKLADAEYVVRTAGGIRNTNLKEMTCT